ncbi:endoribonuclease CG2145-like [Phymastichus coffea]|uniref:endoribonuclease CG2145-like n=1 Tax=Phymastichus coffea TaxID=108790 RepID=UPI00273B9D7B|nr:endoribonuclease CG2145-like [Phymastichus coffea]
MRNVCFLILLVSLAVLVADVDAGWKFWKKETTTAAPSTTASPPPTPSTVQSQPVPIPTQKRTVNPKQGIAAAADASLAIGVGSNGQQLRNGARPPAPGTEVGWDISPPKPMPPGSPTGSHTNYRDWAADIAGAGEPGRQSPKLPAQGPALSPGGTQLPGNRPTPVPGQMPSVATTPISHPISIHGSSTTHRTPATVRSSTTPLSRKPTVRIPQQPIHGGFPPLSPTGHSATPTSPTGGKSWAEVAGKDGNGFGQHPATPAPKPSSPSASRFDYPRPNSGATSRTSGKTYSRNPTYSQGNTVTDEDLEKLSEALFMKDANNANGYITLNLQKQTSGSSPKDEAPQPLLQVKPEALQIPTIQRVLSIHDNYKADTREREHINPAQRQEESLLIDTFLSTNVMSAAMRFLADKNFLKKDYYDYKDKLRSLWFDLYSRGDGKITSSGFEHVFLTELKLGTEVSGLHNWIYFNAEELKKKLDYLGYVKKLDLGDKAAVVKAHVKYNGIDKPVTDLFVGTSPELEMALYTVCFYARPDTHCPVSLAGQKFNIMTHPFRYRGKNLIGSAYPEI